MNMSEQLDRALQLDADAKSRIVDYHSRIGVASLTALSATAAIIAFLVNSHHIAYIQQPAIIRYCLYALVIFYGVAYIATLLAARFDAAYLGWMRDRQFLEATGGSKTAKTSLERKSDREFSWLNRFNHVAEYAALLATIALAIFLISLIHNILKG